MQRNSTAVGQERDKVYSLLPYFFILVSFLALAFNARYAGTWHDENMFLAVIDKFYRGGTPFVDEWGIMQSFAPFLVPLYSLYISAAGSAVGVIYFFRIIAILVKTIIAFAAYRTLVNDFGKLPACVISIVFLFYTPDGINGMTPASISFDFYMAGLLLAWMSYHVFWGFYKPKYLKTWSAPRVLYPLCAGIAVGLSSIANPLVLLVYLLGCVGGIIYALARRSPLFLNPFLWSLVGSLIIICIYILCLLSTSSPSVILDSITALSSDAAFFVDVESRLAELLRGLALNPIGFAGIWILCIFLILLRTRHFVLVGSNFGITLVIGTVFLCMNCFSAVQMGHPEFVLLAFAEFALPCYLMQKDLSFAVHPEFVLFWMPGIALALAWVCTSNSPLDYSLAGCVITCFGGIITLRNAAPQTFSYDNPRFTNAFDVARPLWMRVIACSLIVALALGTALIRLSVPLSLAKGEKLDATLETGPAAGLIATSDEATEVNEIDDLLAKAQGRKSLWASPTLAWIYLDTKMENASPGIAHLTLDNTSIDRFYLTNGHERPDCLIIAPNDNVLPEWASGRGDYVLYSSAPGADLYLKASFSTIS